MPNGKVINNQYEILAEAEQFYENLYTSMNDKLEKINLNHDLAGLNIPKFTNNDSNKLACLLTYKQAKYIVFKMKSNRSPGSNRFTAAFLKCSNIIIKSHL